MSFHLMNDTDTVTVDDNSDEDFDEFITLKSPEFENRIQWRFPNSNICPSCGISCSARNVAIVHFRNTHADKSMVCVFCDYLFEDAAKLLYHHALNHSEYPPPKLRERKINQNDEKNNVQKQPQPLKNVEREVEEEKREEEEEKAEEEEDNIDDEDDDDDDDVITLHGLGQVTYWRFPQKLKRCPVKNCHVQFGVRSDAINHYRKRHANCSILCPICVEPKLCTLGLKIFKEHYKRVHPNEKLPYNLDRKTKSKVKKTALKGEYNSDTEIEWRDSNEVDDLIELKGLDKTTFWNFPKHINHCPVIGCGLTFATRSKAIDHYRKKHANHFILCSICVKPISAQIPERVQAHYRLHPDAEIPSYIRGRTIRSPEPQSRMEKEKRSIVKINNDKISQSEDDLITLSGCGKPTKWRFPEGLKKCPNHLCNAMKFETRQDAISHYKEQHAKHSIFCTSCEKPIHAKQISSYLKHCKRMHSNKFPPDFERGKNLNMISCEICGIMVKDTTIKRHTREVHSGEMRICPLKGCDYKRKRLSLVREHWKKHHPNLQFPEIRRGCNRNFRTNRLSSKQEESLVVEQESQNAPNTPLQTVTSNTPVQPETPHNIQEIPTIPTISTTPTKQASITSEESLLTPLRTASEIQSEISSSFEEINLRCLDCSYVSKTVFGLKMHRNNRHNVPRKRKCKRIIPRSSRFESSTTDMEDEQVKKVVKRRRLVKKRVHIRDTDSQDSVQEDKANIQRLENDEEQQKSRGTLPLNGLTYFVSDGIENNLNPLEDPLKIHQPLDLSVAKIIYVLDSDEETTLKDNQTENDEVKPIITSENISN